LLGIWPDGTLDSSFGRHGRVATVGSRAIGNAIDSAGRIVTLTSGGVARYLPDGSPDKSFGSGGRTAAFDAEYVGAFAIDSPFPGE
jgi:hypothetical protein